jgi:hypothetical protein
VQQIGPDQDAFFEFWAERLAGEVGASRDRTPQPVGRLL